MTPSSEPLPHASRLRRFTTAEYMRMVDSGIFGVHERLALVDWVPYRLPTPTVEHARLVQVLSGLLFPQFSVQYALRVRLPLQIGDANVPVPDLAVVSHQEATRRDSHPRQALLVIVIEVASDPASGGLAARGALYARHGVPGLWLVDAERQQVAADWRLDAEVAVYAEHATAQARDVLVSQALPGLSIPLGAAW